MASEPQRSLNNGVEENMMGVLALEPDALLMTQVRAGDSASFATLLNRHRLAVTNFLNRMVQNRAVAEELAQDVFLRVYRSRGTYEPTARFKTWLFRIASHRALNWLRDEHVRQSSDDFSDIRDRRPNAETRLLQEVRLEEVRRAIRRLPEKQRAAVLMHKYQEMEYAEIAEVLGCSESALKSLLFRAYETLREQLAQYA